jgi:uncharacterized protein (DUF1684 family)
MDFLSLPAKLNLMLQFNMNTPWIWVLAVALLSFSYGTDPKYVEEIKNWQKERVESLKKEDGWLNLAGLFWLKPGSNTFGAGAGNQIIFPKGKSAAQLGRLILENGEVWVESKPEAEVWQGENRVERLKIFSPGSTPLVLRHGSLRWFVIKRGEKYGIRLRDLEHPNLSHFQGIESYPIDSKWKVIAKLEKFPEEKKIAITDVLGQTSMQPSSGALVFELKGKTYRLEPIDEGEQFFILFGDKTNAKHTYQSGRFLYAQKPVAGTNTVILDFNKAYNPPCAFTAFATCPLPPAQNVLTVAIQGGEKRYGEGHE